MAITDKTRKILWGASGSRCAFCHCPLVIERTPFDADAVVGDECHIISGKRSGPRFDPQLPDNMLDDLSNLMLLCRVHHKMIDDQPAGWTPSKLRELKTSHERWVASRLNPTPSAVRLRSLPDGSPEYLPRITRGQDIYRIIDGACSSEPHYDELEDDVEVELIASFFELVQDYCDMSGDYEMGERIRAERQLSLALNELHDAGFRLFAAREVRQLEGGIGGPAPWPVAIVHVLRSTNPAIVEIPSSP